ncbi:MAG: DUF6788 family protein [Actinomycetes bacterium]
MSAPEEELQAEISAIKLSLAKLGRLHPGSLSAQRRARGGEYLQLSYSYLGKGHTRYVRPEDVPALEQQMANYRRFRKLTGRWLQLEIELSRLSCEEGRRTKG